MDDNRLTVSTELPSYNGLARAALIPKVGMPLVPTIIACVVPLFTTMLLMPFIQAKAFAICLISIPLLAFIKTVSANDDQAIRIHGLQLLWVFRRRQFRMFGKTNTILATRFGRQKNDYQRFFEEHLKQTTGTRGFSAEHRSAR